MHTTANYYYIIIISNGLLDANHLSNITSYFIYNFLHNVFFF